MKKIIVVSAVLVCFGAIGPAWAEQACFDVQGMTCATCPLTVKAAIKKLKGIAEVSASLKENSAVVDFDSQKTNATEIKQAIDGVGYKATPKACKKI